MPNDPRPYLDWCQGELNRSKRHPTGPLTSTSFGTINWDSMFPPGSIARVVNDIFDPFRTEDLKRRSIVTIKSSENKKKITWITVEDEKGLLWAVQPRDLESVNTDTQQKKGRFRILAMDDIIEKAKEEGAKNG